MGKLEDICNILCGVNDILFVDGYNGPLLARQPYTNNKFLHIFLFGTITTVDEEYIFKPYLLSHTKSLRSCHLAMGAKHFHMEKTFMYFLIEIWGGMQHLVCYRIILPTIYFCLIILEPKGLEIVIAFFFVVHAIYPYFV